MIASLGCSQDPSVGRDWILGSTEAVHNQKAEVDAGTGVALLRGLLEPMEGILIALANTLSAEEHNGEVVLAKSVAVLGGELVPMCSERVILNHAKAAIVEIT